MLLLIDNYDSFTWNLYHLIGMQTQRAIQVVRNDAISVAQALEMKPAGIILSPGPCTPNEAGICLKLIEAAAQHTIPLFGVCLGHQSLGQALGGHVVRAQSLWHGKVDTITHTGGGLMKGLPSPFHATRYHSLVVDQATLPASLVVDATSSDGVIMAIHHAEKPLFGVQFHPESIATEHGAQMVQNFLDVVG